MTRSGAVYGDGPQAGVPLHFGQPLVEQRALARSGAAAHLPYGVLTLAGVDRLTWLDSITSQRLRELRPGESTETLVLAPTGQIEHHLKLVDDGETLWGITESDRVADVVAWLDRMKFMMRVEIADRSTDFAVVGDAAPAGAAPRAGATIAWRDPWPAVLPGGASYARADADYPEHDWRESIVPRAELAGALGPEPSGFLAAEALRIEAWRPRLDAEVDHKTQPAELDWLRTAVHLNKGCYRGQEAVARLHNMGAPPRRIVFLHLDGSGHLLPPAGTPVFGELRGSEREVGTITSAALHHELGPVALAVIKRGVPDDAALTAVFAEERVAAAQEIIVATDRERVAPMPPRNPLVQRR